MIELKTYQFKGTPEQIGHGHGEALRETIQRFVQVRLEAAARYFQQQGIKEEGLIDGLRHTGKRCWQMLGQWDPQGFAEHNAIARAARVDAADLYTITNYTDVRDAYRLTGNRPDAEGCTALMAPPSCTRENRLLAGQTWDLNPEDIDYVIASLCIPNKGPARWNIALAGCLSLMGMNSLGLAVGTTNLKTWGSRPGIGYINLIHRSLRCQSLTEAASLLAGAPKSGAHSYWLADAHQGIRFEVTGFSQDQEHLGDNPWGWTNHCLNPVHQAQEYEPPSASSLARLERLQKLTGTPLSVEGIKTLFANREDGANSINRYWEDRSYAATNACLIADPGQGEIHACRGPADRGRWLRLDFS